jgi:hypothetical protein
VHQSIHRVSIPLASALPYEFAKLIFVKTIAFHDFFGSDPAAIAATPPFRDTRPAAAVAGDDQPEPTRLPSTPCPHPPGSAGRVETYRARAAAGEFLYHPADAGFEEALP